MRRLLGSCLILGCLAGAGTASAGSSFTRALEDGEVDYDLRYRYERVNQDPPPAGTPFDGTAKASTLRLRLGYETAEFFNFKVYVAFHGTLAHDTDKYNDTINGRNLPVIADPEDQAFNQGYLSYVGWNDAEIKFGRQRIKLDNDRFVGNVGWRQLEQTYDGLTVAWQPERLRFYFARLNTVNRVFGEHHPNPSLAKADVTVDVLQAGLRFEAGSLTAYAHSVEFDDFAAGVTTCQSPAGAGLNAACSHRNVGLRFRGQREISRDGSLSYTAEVAQQTDTADGDPVIDADYVLAEIGLKGKRRGVRVGYEVLGGDGVYGFQTPLATLHGFNGWADKFLTTPAGGLRDVYGAVKLRLAGLDVQAIYHDFSADSGGMDYGTEWDLVASKELDSGWSFGAWYASYSADALFTDTEKFWFVVRLKG